MFKLLLITVCTLVSMLQSTLCAICTNDSSKYKCPKCKISYCSLSCFKKHKDSPECESLPIELKSIIDECKELENILKTDSTIVSYLSRAIVSKSLQEQLESIREILNYSDKYLPYPSNLFKFLEKLYELYMNHTIS